MEVKEWPIEEVKPYKKNPRNNDDAVEATANSIREFGWQQPIVVDKDGVIIVGHTRLKAAKKLKLDQVPVTVAENLTDDQVKAYRLADNKTGELADWDQDLLDSELAGILSIDMTELGFDADADANLDPEADEEYTMKVDAPHYEITGADPSLDMLVDTSKADELTKAIDDAKLPKDVAQFLKQAATRHYKFDYASIAEYYAHADKEVQKLFEDSALVIIDFDDAIKNGYVKLSDRLLQMRDGENDE